MNGTKHAQVIQIKAGPDDGLDEGHVEALISVYGAKDTHRQRVPGPESFTRWASAVNDDMVKTPVVWQHEIRDPWLYIGEVSHAEPNGVGLKGESGLALSMAFDIDTNPTAAQAYRQVKGRRIPQWSYRWSGQAAKADDGIDDLTDMWVHEASPVLQGAVASTHTLGTKDDDALTLASRIADLDADGRMHLLALIEGGDKRAFTTEQRVALAKKGWAIPVKDDAGDIVDGRYPIESTEDCKNAISAIGRVAGGDRAMVIAHIKRQARRLGISDMIPDGWKDATSILVAVLDIERGIPAII